MDWLLGTGVVIGMFLLRLGVPLLFTVALGWALHRLDAKWHSEPADKPDAGGQNQDQNRGMHSHQWILRRKPS
jgi:hypothetical protein